MPEGVGTDAGGGGIGAEGAGAEEEGAEVEASGPQARVLRVPENVIEGSFGFQQFFRIYAKLMARLKDSNVRELDMTHLATHKVVMSVGKPSREELVWAI